MAYGIKVLNRIQLGQETTGGTAVAATVLWRGEGTLEDARVLQEVDEDVGQMLPTSRIITPKLGANIVLDSTPATFEQLPYILAMNIESLVTGSADGSGTGKIYAFDVPTTTQGTVKTFTLECGDNVGEWDVEYVFGESFELTGAEGEAVMMSANAHGRQLTAASFASLTPATVREIMFSKGKIYVDDTTIGTTQRTGTWVGFSLAYNSGQKALYTGDGALYFYGLKSTRPEITGELVFEHDAFGTAEVAKAQAKTKRLVRMVFEGDALTTAGTAYTYFTLKIDASIVYTAVPSLEDNDGDNQLRFPFKGVYDAAADAPVFTVVNQLTSLT